MDTFRDKRDKVAVITGAASGIGRAIACALAHRGAAEPPQRADVSDPGAFDGIRSAALQRFGRIDVGVTNVGVPTNGLPPLSGADQYRRCRAVFGAGAPLRIPGEQFEPLDPSPVGELVADAILRNRFFVPIHVAVVDGLRRLLDDGDAYIDYPISR